MIGHDSDISSMMDRPQGGQPLTPPCCGWAAPPALAWSPGTSLQIRSLVWKNLWRRENWTSSRTPNLTRHLPAPPPPNAHPNAPAKFQDSWPVIPLPSGAPGGGSAPHHRANTRKAVQRDYLLLKLQGKSLVGQGLPLLGRD